MIPNTEIRALSILCGLGILTQLLQKGMIPVMFSRAFDEIIEPKAEMGDIQTYFFSWHFSHEHRGSDVQPQDTDGPQILRG